MSKTQKKLKAQKQKLDELEAKVELIQKQLTTACSQCNNLERYLKEKHGAECSIIELVKDAPADVTNICEYIADGEEKHQSNNNTPPPSSSGYVSYLSSFFFSQPQGEFK